MYFGRMPLALVTPDGKPAAGYLVQARSLSNRKRKIEPLPDRLYVAPLDPKDLEKPDSDLIFYHTMLCKGNTLVVTNGAQTDMPTLSGRAVRNFEKDFSDSDPMGEAEVIMQDWGYEPDSMSTPRVALVRCPDKAVFAIASKHDHGGVGAISMTVVNACGLPTYTERDGQAVSLSIEKSGYLHRYLVDIPVTGSTAKEIADQLYDLGGDIIVASAGAVFSDERWGIAFRNRFETLEEFEAFAGSLK